MACSNGMSDNVKTKFGSAAITNCRNSNSSRLTFFRILMSFPYLDVLSKDNDRKGELHFSIFKKNFENKQSE